MDVSPSILSADFANLETSISKISSKINYLHVDVMDGHFVPNLTIGAPVVKALRCKFSMLFDVHLMISNPCQYINDFVDAGSDYLTVHIEANDPLLALKQIKEKGIKAGISIKPNTPISQIIPVLDTVDMVLVMSVEPGFGGQKFMPIAIDKIKELVKLRKENNYHYVINVDGGINLETGALVAEAGTDIAVAGNFVFKSADPLKAVEDLKCV